MFVLPHDVHNTCLRCVLLMMMHAAVMFMANVLMALMVVLAVVYPNLLQVVCGGS